jgi:hypothetical protein
MKLSPHYRRQEIKVYQDLDERIHNLAARSSLNRDLQNQIWEIASHACKEAVRVGINTGRARAKLQFATGPRLVHCADPSTSA